MTKNSVTYFMDGPKSVDVARNSTASIRIQRLVKCNKNHVLISDYHATNTSERLLEVKALKNHNEEEKKSPNGRDQERLIRFRFLGNSGRSGPYKPIIYTATRNWRVSLSNWHRREGSHRINSLKHEMCRDR